MSRRTMGADKLHEKRLKERARRNGMAVSIEQMRTVVPVLKSSTKVYSQAKVVAFALAHIEELQAENARLRAENGLPEVFPVNPKRKITAKRERSPGSGTSTPTASSNPRPTKRARMSSESAVVTQTPTESSVASVDEDFVDVEHLAVAKVTKIPSSHFIANPAIVVTDTTTVPATTHPFGQDGVHDPLSEESHHHSHFDHFDSASLDWNMLSSAELDSLPMLESFFA